MGAITHERSGARALVESSAPAGYELIETFSYQDKNGNTAQIAARYEPLVADGEKKKTFKQFTVENGTIVAKAMADKRPLYNLPELLANPDKPVLVVEGEGVADRAIELLGDDFLVTTSIGGAKAAGRTDWTPLKSRPVIVWPDHDAAGAGYAKAVLKHVPHAKVVEVPATFPARWDLADSPPMGISDADLRKLIDNAGNGSAFEAMPLPRTTSMAGNGKAPQSIRKMQEQRAASALADKYCNKDGSPLTDAQLKERVANLDDAAYDRVRRDMATGTGVRTRTLDRIRSAARADLAAAPGFAEIEPWPEPVDLDALLDAFLMEANRYLVLPEGGAETIALIVVLAHAYDAFEVAPILALLSPTPEAGKTRTLCLIKGLTPKALIASNISPAAMFRCIEAVKPTLLIDELDSFLKDDDLRNVLNGGLDKDSAFTMRCTGENQEPRLFSTWCPKVLAAIGTLPATIISRSIILRMRRKLASEVRQELRPSRIGAVLLPLKRQAARWAADNCEALAKAEPTLPPALYAREADKWRPLLAIADMAGGGWAERAREVAVLLGGRQDEDLGMLLLGSVQKVFAAGNLDRVTSKELAAALAEMEGSPWPEYYRGQPISTNQIAKKLKPFGIAPVSIRPSKSAISTAKGYYARDFEDAFKRYLAAQCSEPAGTPAQD